MLEPLRKEIEIMATKIERTEVKYTAPVLVTQFSSRMRHPAYVQLCEYSKQSCAGSLISVAAAEAVSRHIACTACGGCYAAHIYPDGDFERLKIVADNFSARVLVDNLMDSATDILCVSDMVNKYRATVAGSPVEDERFKLILRLYTNACWDPEALRLIQAETNRYLDCTVELRTIEAEVRAVSVEEYFESRATNSYMGVEHHVIAFAMPELTEDLVRVSVSAPEVFRRALMYSGTSMGVMADLYKINGEHPEICEYTSIINILQRASEVPLSLPEAVGRSVQLFHEYEDKLAVALEEVAAFSPALAKAMECVHAGTVVWLNMMRGDRYARKILMPARQRA